MGKFRRLAVAAAVAMTGVFPIGSANALTVGIFNDDDLNGAYDATVRRATLTCSLCSVLTFDGTNYSFSASFGELFDGASVDPPGNPPSQESDWLNSVLGTNYPDATDADKTETTDANKEDNWLSTALYVILTVGNLPNYTIIRNDSGGEFSFSWVGAKKGGAGLSHFTEVGTVSAVPVPAALPLLLTGLAGLGLLSRRNKLP